jgi:hypothetical protein
MKNSLPSYVAITLLFYCVYVSCTISDKLLSVFLLPAINDQQCNLSPVLTTPAINENPGKSVVTRANDSGNYFIAVVIDTAEQHIAGVAGVVNTVL